MLKKFSMCLGLAVITTGCQSPKFDDTGLIYDSKNQGELNYVTLDRPYANKTPLSANAAAQAWLTNQEMFIELTGGQRMNASLSYFVTKLRDAGAVVESTFPVAGMTYNGKPLPARLSARDMLEQVSSTLGINYLATYNTNGHPFIKLHRQGRHDFMRPSEIRPKGLLESINVRDGETLISVAQRLADDKGYANVIFDMVHSGPQPHVASADFSGIIQGDGVRNLLDILTQRFQSTLPRLRMLEARDHDGWSLVMTDRDFKMWEDLRVYEVAPTTLSENAIRLAEFYNWNADPMTSWRLDTDYTIVAPYKIVVSDVRQAFTRIFEAYPVKAKLVGSSQTALFVNRPMPVSRSGAHR